MAKKTRKWCESRICGRKVDVWLGPSDEIKVLETAEGAAHGPTGTIVIDDALAQDGAEETLVHEEMHLMFDYSGARHILREELGITPERWMSVEENLIRLLAPAFLNSYRASGRLKMPKRPRGHTVSLVLGDLVKSRLKKCGS
jgi:hypothetical protein